MPQFRRPLLPSHYVLWFEPPDETGDEVLRLASERRRLKLKGRSFREFHRRVVPLLDGQHSVTEIEDLTADAFGPGEVAAALDILGGQGVLAEGDAPAGAPESAERLAPQLNYFHEMTEGGRVLQARLADATVAVVGLGGAGAATALALATAGVGRLVCVDPGRVAAPDLYYAPFLPPGDLGRSRAASVRDRVRDAASGVAAEAAERPLDTEEDLRRAIAGADYVVCCLDAGQLNAALKLNRVCLAEGLPWITCSLGGDEARVGPAFAPPDGPCFLCYRMRAVACAGNPEEAFAHERYLDRRRADDGGRREGLTFAAGLAANLLASEVVKVLTGSAPPSLVGRLLTVGLADLRATKHTVLRKPGCPACFATAGAP